MLSYGLLRSFCGSLCLLTLLCRVGDIGVFLWVFVSVHIAMLGTGYWGLSVGLCVCLLTLLCRVRDIGVRMCVWGSGVSPNFGSVSGTDRRKCGSRS